MGLPFNPEVVQWDGGNVIAVYDSAVTAVEMNPVMEIVRAMLRKCDHEWKWRVDRPGTEVPDAQVRWHCWQSQRPFQAWQSTPPSAAQTYIDPAVDLLPFCGPLTMTPLKPDTPSSQSTPASGATAPAPLSYGGYLQLETLLGCQQTESGKHGAPAHDELLFIVIHQTYELWFKQMLHEVDAVLKLMNTDSVRERDVGRVVLGLERVIQIQRVLVDQVNILETMTPLDFLEFRNLLSPSSGFQSAQFRALENKLGLKRARRQTYNAATYDQALPERERATALDAESQPNLLECLDAWLARMPFLQMQGWSFWATYRERVDAMLSQDEVTIRAAHGHNPAALVVQLQALQATRGEFALVHDRAQYEKSRAEGLRYLSHEAFLAALMINLYRDEPILQTPFRLLTALVEIDENLSLWRYRHMVMVQRMIGSKIGTGGSSGHAYLRKTVESHRIFKDLFDLSTYLLPRSHLPPLPAPVAQALDFHRSRSNE
jgi:tryptophan 2,3-dioxygenase